MAGAILLWVLACVCAAANAQHCFSGTGEYCQKEADGIPICSAIYGHPETTADQHGVKNKLINDYVQKMIEDSYFYLLSASHFETYKYKREGFHKLATKISDESWENAFKVLKHTYKRGGEIPPASLFFGDDFVKVSQQSIAAKLNGGSVDNVEQSEIKFLAKALDRKKAVAEHAFKIAKHDHRDHELISFLENNFVHQDADWIRNLAGHHNTMKTFTTDETTYPLAVEIFDNYIKSIY